MIDQILEKFEAWLSRSRSPKTIAHYVHQARDYLNWLESSSYLDEKGDLELTGRRLDEYVTHLTPHYSANTVTNYYRCICSFYKFMGLAAELYEIDPPKEELVDIECPTKEEIDKMMAAAKSPYERALLSLQFGAALRVGELIPIMITDLDIDKLTLTINSEKKRRGEVTKVTIPVAPSVVEDLAAWLNSRDDEYPHMWPSALMAGRVSRTGHVTARAVNVTYERMCRRAGVRVYTTHQVRHATATWLLKMGVERTYVRQFCRWNSDRAMKRYDHLVPMDLQGVLPDPFSKVEVAGGKKKKRRRKNSDG